MSAVYRDPDPELSRLVESYLDLRWQADPVDASGNGVQRQDHRLGTFRPADIREYLAALKSLSGALEECSTDSLEDEIDRTALLNEMRAAEHRFQRERPHVLNPAFWLTHAFDGLYLLLVARDRTRDHRAWAVAQRLRALPGFLQAARDSLEDCPAVFVETGIEIAKAGHQLIDQVTRELTPPDDADFPTVVADAREAMVDFMEYLVSRPLEGQASFAIGEEAFNFRLHYEHAIQASAPELWRYGHRLMERTERDLVHLARDIDPSKPWHELVDSLRDMHPTAEQLVAAYSEAMDRSRRFVEEHELVSVPLGDLTVVETPTFLQPLIPFAAYHPPGPFSEDRSGWFYVTPPAAHVEKSAAERMLRDHCVHELACTALHEGYPGHHLQFLTAQAQPRVIRKVIGTPVTVEGWALYCEEMMGEHGFYESVEERFFQRVALLWRAVRVVADVELHTRDMSFDQAVQLLVDRLHFDVANAKTEVRRYCAHPAYQLCYAVGRRELLSLREAYQESMGEEYAVRQFHERVLSYGGLPVSLMRWGMGLGG